MDFIYNYVALENLVIILLICVVLLALILNSLANRTNTIIDRLEEKIMSLEERVGLKEPFDMDPIGFTRPVDSD